MRIRLVSVVAIALLVCSTAQAQNSAPAGSLKIVVISGEDAVNIIQQKTAVAPVIEVRDRNDLPVLGVAVTFSVSGPGASFAGGVQSITVVTNATGQAAAAGLTPTATGAINISATATFQGQTAIATIAQSNVMTAAEAVSTTTGATGGAGSTTGGTTGAAGGGVGGLSGATLGIIGGVAGAGGLVAVKAAGGGDSPTTTSTTPPAVSTAPTTSSTPTVTTPSPSPAPAPTPTPTSASLSGPMDGTMNGTSTVTILGDPASSCTFTLRQTGTVALRTQTASSGAFTGTFESNGRQVVTASTCQFVSGVLADGPITYTAPVEGSGGTVRFSQEFRDSGSVAGGSYTSISPIGFTGTVTSGGVTGTLTYNAVADVRGDGFTSRATWVGNIPVTLR